MKNADISALGGNIRIGVCKSASLEISKSANLEIGKSGNQQKAQIGKKADGEETTDGQGWVQAIFHLPNQRFGESTS